MNFNTIPAEIDKVVRKAREVVRETLLKEVALNISGRNNIEDGRRVLVGYAQSNRSSWSGGPFSGTNIHEALIREEAIKLAAYHDLWHLSQPYLPKAEA